MSNDQLRWHLLREMSEILVKKLQPPNLVPLSTLLLSGKGPAKAVKMILSQNIHVTMQDQDYYFVDLDEKEFEIELKYFKKLGLRWARSLTVSVDRGEAVPEFINTLRDHNSVDTIRLSSDLDLWDAAVTIIDVCPKVSSLISGQSLLHSLLRCQEVDFSKIRSIELTQFDLKDTHDGYPVNFPECKFIFEALAKRCPNLETLVIGMADELINFLVCVSGHIMPSVKSLTLDTSDGFHAPACFSFLSSIMNAFPNVAKFCLTNYCFAYKGDLNALFNGFKSFEHNFAFNFDCHVELYKAFSTYEEVDPFYKELETTISAYGTITSIVDKRRNGLVEYAATMSYPNKTMAFELSVTSNVSER